MKRSARSGGCDIFGKWHLGDNYPLRAMDQGFEESLVHRGSGIGQPSDPPGGEGKYTDAVLFRNGTREETTGYRTDVYFDAAFEFMERAPRIVVGTDHEPVTVLTRQDWRRITDDQGWRPTSRGRWLLSTLDDATFDVEVRLVAGSSGPVPLEVGERTIRQDLASGQGTAIFEGVAVPAGDFALSTAAGKGEERRGAHQVVLRRRQRRPWLC